MGFEKNYEQVLRRPRWGGIVNGLKHSQESKRLAEGIEKRLAWGIRKNEFAGLSELSRLFQHTFSALVDAQRLRISVPGAGYQDALNHFQTASQAIQQEFEIDHEVGRFIGMALDELRGCRRAPDRLNTCPEEATSRLLDKFLREYAKEVLDPALPTICSYSGESWDAIEKRLSEVASGLRLEGLIRPIVKGQPALAKAPRTAQKSVDALLNVSLLPGRIGRQ